MVKSSNTDEEPSASCSICRKVFRERHKLKRHMMIHTGEKPYTCIHCDKAFSLEYNLNTHIRVHTGEKPYRCDYEGCGKSFTQSGNLKTHKKTNHSSIEGHKAAVKTEETEEKQRKNVSFDSIMSRALSDFGKSLDF